MKLEIEDVHRTLYRDVPDRFQDLIEIATYVYCADQAIKRIGQDTDSFGGQWRRHFRFLIPVRDEKFWSAAQADLAALLGFLSDDFYSFEFSTTKGAPAFQQYLDFGDGESVVGSVDRVMMFSGGLDSLAGAVDEIVRLKQRLVLVTHLPTPKNSAFLRALGTELRRLAGSPPPIQVSVRINKDEGLGVDYTQRTRSFLFAALGATVAHMLKQTQLRFYENGVVSLNLPVCAQVIGGRATRTTHPFALALMGNLFSRIVGSDFTLDNPFLWKTKGEVVSSLVKNGAGALIEKSISCAHTWERSKEHTHCGGCSQCIDRRFAVVAVGAEALDPLRQYKTDIFTERRNKEEDRILMAGYVERARRMKRITNDADLVRAFPVVARVFNHVGGTATVAARNIIDLHHRHADEVEQALAAQLKHHAHAIVTHQLPPDCLLQMAVALPATPSTNGAKPPPNNFVCGGNVWRLRYDGRPEVLIQKHLRGCAYLHVLLTHPGKEFEIEDLVATAGLTTADTVLAGHISPEELKSGFATTMGIPLTDSGEVLDEKALGAIRKKWLELKEARAEAQERGQESELLRIETEIEQLSGRVNRDVGKRGRARRLQDLRKRQRDAVCNSLRRTLAEIASRETVAGAHLNDCVKAGRISSYSPSSGRSWSSVRA